MARHPETEAFVLRLPLGATERIRALLPSVGPDPRRGQAGIGPLLRRWVMERLAREEAASVPPAPPQVPATDLLARVQALLDDPDPGLRARLERRITLTEDDRARWTRAAVRSDD